MKTTGKVIVALLAVAAYVGWSLLSTVGGNPPGAIAKPGVWLGKALAGLWYRVFPAKAQAGPVSLAGLQSTDQNGDTPAWVLVREVPAVGKTEGFAEWVNLKTGEHRDLPIDADPNTGN